MPGQMPDLQAQLALVVLESLERSPQLMAIESLRESVEMLYASALELLTEKIQDRPSSIINPNTVFAQ